MTSKRDPIVTPKNDPKILPQKGPQKRNPNNKTLNTPHEIKFTVPKIENTPERCKEKIAK